MLLALIIPSSNSLASPQLSSQRGDKYLLPAKSALYPDSIMLFNKTNSTEVLSQALAITAGGLHTCALTTSGGVKCWGDNQLGQLGNITQPWPWSPIPVDVSGLTSGVAAIDAAIEAHTCALTTSGGVKCWGHNFWGQLGNNSTIDSPTPVDVSGLTSGVAAIATGGYHTCALTTGGGIKCWGNNYYGQLGDNSNTNSLTPVDVLGLNSGVTAITAGMHHTCALTTGGGVKCWGDDQYGQLGNSEANTSWIPVDVSELTSGVAAIDAGWNHTCAVTTGGGAKCWGFNLQGELGDDSKINRQTPVDVSGLTNGVITISAGGWHTCALITGGGVKCWGFNSDGQLGNDSKLASLKPVDVSGLTSGIVAITTGYWHTCALTTSGGIKCWGNNELGRLGDGTAIDRLTPVDVVGFGGGDSISFRPNPDGYYFANSNWYNEGRTPESEFTMEDMRHLFGDDVVCVSVENGVCQENLLARMWYEYEAINPLRRGHCDGFTSTSLRFYKGLDKLSDFQSGAQSTYELKRDLLKVRKNISYFQILQFTPFFSTIAKDIGKNSPTNVIQLLWDSFASGANDPYVLGIVKGDLSAAHALVPYAVSDLGAGTWWIWVYDPNQPNESNRRVVVNTNTETWEYEMFSGDFWSGGIIEYADGSSWSTLQLMPLSAYQPEQHGACPWCDDYSVPTPFAQISLANYGGHILLSDSGGRRLGYLGNDFIDEIPNAFGLPEYGSAQIPREPTYYVPITDTYTMLLDGQTLDQTLSATITQFGPGYALLLENIEIGTASQDEIKISKDGSAVIYQTNEIREPTITIALDSASDNQQFTIQEADFMPGDIVGVTVDLDVGKLKFDNSMSAGGEYNFSFKLSNELSKQIFLHRAIDIPASATHYLDFGSWDGSGSMVLEIDLDSDGNINEYVDLENEANLFYLPIAIR